jgi:hypothetical protein
MREEGASFLGTCFPFRDENQFLTAAHCVGQLTPSQLAIGIPVNIGAGPIEVTEILVHPTADIAVLRTPKVAEGAVTPFWDYVSNYSYGEEFMSFGYPEDIFGPSTRQPTARLFRGHFQRLLDHKSHLGYAYTAAELNIGCPAGLSGGPVFRPGAVVMLTGLVTENLESMTMLHSVEEIQKDGALVRERFHSVINYGVALLLDRVSDWLNSIVPPLNSGRVAEIARKGV